MKKLFLLANFLLFAGAVFGEDFRQISGAVHIHSRDFSEVGKLSLEEIAVKAKKYNLDFIVITDHDIFKFEYGLAPFRNILKISVSGKSILKIGPEKYLQKIQELNKKYPDLIIVPGVESACAYWWERKGKNFVLHDWHCHLVIIGLTLPTAYRQLPVTGNKYRPDYGRKIPTKRYQELIDYCNYWTGLVFWAHPEAPNWKEPVRLNKFVSLQTKPYPEMLTETYNYTGFGYLEEGQNTGSPGGLWDKILLEYCQKKREKPVWAIGELDYIADGYHNTYLDSNKNVLLVKEKSLIGIKDAFSTGRLYITKPADRTRDEFVLDCFISENGNFYYFGQKCLSGSKKLKLKIKIMSRKLKIDRAKINVIVNGVIKDTLIASVPEEITYVLDNQQGCSYVRLEIFGPENSRAITNPIFFGHI